MSTFDPDSNALAATGNANNTDLILPPATKVFNSHHGYKATTDIVNESLTKLGFGEFCPWPTN